MKTNLFLCCLLSLVVMIVGACEFVQSKEADYITYENSAATRIQSSKRKDELKGKGEQKGKDELYAPKPSPIGTLKRVRSGRPDADQTAEKSGSHEARRHQLLRDELDGWNIRTVSHQRPASANESQMVRLLMDAARLIDDIYALQMNGHNLIWREQIVQSGGELEMEFFNRFRRPWCIVQNHLLCNAIASLPTNQTGDVFWPRDFSEDAFGAVSRMINEKELLSPYGLVSWDGPKRLVAIPYSQDSRFSALFRDLSNTFSLAAKVARDGEKGVLEKLSRIVQGGNIHDLDMDDVVKAGGQGEWRIYFGGGSTALDRFGRKKAFRFMAGKIHGPAAAKLSAVKTLATDIHQSFAATLGDHAASIETISTPDLTALDIWIAAGEWADAAMSIDKIHAFEPSQSELILQPHMVLRERYLALLYGMSSNNAVAMDVFAEIWGLKKTAADFETVVDSIRLSGNSGTIATDARIGEREANLKSALRVSGLLWLLNWQHGRLPYSSDALTNAVAVVLADMLLSIDSTDGDKVATPDGSRWMMAQLLAEGAISVVDGARPVRFNPQSVLAVGRNRFEEINRALVSSDTAALERLRLWDRGNGDSRMGETEHLPELVSVMRQLMPKKPMLFEYRIVL
ncbi:MAG: hypothetical protein JXR76_15135 [Deltaproteobacteria bacterium]|nr:hypothetical protein [Deltaproteobacteria bacterium]